MSCTKEQVRLLFKNYQRIPLRQAAAKAGMSINTARKYVRGPVPGVQSAPREYRTSEIISPPTGARFLACWRTIADSRPRRSWNTWWTNIPMCTTSLTDALFVGASNGGMLKRDRAGRCSSRKISSQDGRVSRIGRIAGSSESRSAAKTFRTYCSISYCHIQDGNQ